LYSIKETWKTCVENEPTVGDADPIVLDGRFSSPSLLQFWLSSNPSPFRENPEQRKKNRSLNVEKPNRTQNITKKLQKNLSLVASHLPVKDGRREREREL
jgi:hypothetical protein